jgi:chromosome segregation ATPase
LTEPLQRLEAALPSAREKFESLSHTYDKLAATDSANAAALGPIREQVRKVRERFAILAKFKRRLPPSAPVMFHIDDLENTYRHLREFVAQCTAEIPCVRAKIEATTAKHGAIKAELERLTTETDRVIGEIDEKKAQIAAVFAQLETSSSLLQSINEERKQEVHKMKPARAEIDKLRTRVREAELELIAQGEKLQTELNTYNPKLKAAREDNATLLQKKRVMCEGLEKKLEELRQDLIERQSNQPEVQALTHELEQEWIEHQKLLEVFEDTEKKLQNTQLDLERTELAMREMEIRWPVKGSVKRKKGIGELESVYEEALIQNRQLGRDLALLKDEVAVLEEMNQTLRTGLDTGV